MADVVEKQIIMNITADPSTAKKQMIDLNAEIKKLSDSNKELKKQMEAAIKAGDSKKVEELSGAIVENNANLKSLRSTANQVERQLMASADSMDELRAKTALMTKQANQFKVGVDGDQAALAKLQHSIMQNNKAIRDFDQGMGNNKSSIGNYKQAIMEAIKGNGGMTNSIYSMGSAVTANPLGMLVMIIIKLIDQLHKIQPVMDVVNEVMGAASAVIDVMIARVGNLIKAIAAFATGDFTTAAVEFSTAVSGVGDALVDAAVAGRDFARMQKEIDDNFQIQSLQMEANETRMKGLLKQLNDTTKSEKERLQVAGDIQKLENENLKILEDKAKGELKLARQQLIRAFDKADQAKAEKMSDAELLKLGQDKAKQDSLLEALTEKAIALERLKGESIALTEKVEARANAIRQKGEEDRLRAAQKAEEQRKKAAEQLAKDEEKRKQAAEKAIADQEKLIKAEFDTTQKATKIAYDQQNTLLKQRLADNLITEQQYNDELKNIQLNRLNSELLNLQDYNATEEEIAAKKIEIANYIADNQIAANKKVTEQDKIEKDKQIANIQAQAAATEALVSSAGALFAQSLEEQGLNMRKFSKGVLNMVIDMVEKVILAQVAQSTAVSLAQPDSVATFGATGAIRAAVMAGLIKGAFAVAKTQINAYAKGSDYTKAGLALVGEEGPELVQMPLGARVFPAQQTKQMLPYVGAYANGGIVGDGGFAARSISQQVSASLNTSDFIAAMKHVNLSVSVQEINQKQSNVKAYSENTKW